MDVEETLKAARSARDELNNATDGSDAYVDAAESLADAFTALDEWLSARGFPPADWARNA